MALHTEKEVQARLNELGFNAGPVDGDFGKRSQRALIEFQKGAGLEVDGDFGPKTDAALFALAPLVVFRPAGAVIGAPGVVKDPGPKKFVWPRQADVERFYGPPGGPRAEAGRCRLPFAFRLAWEPETAVSSFTCHELVADAFAGIFADAAAAYGAEGMRDLGLDLFGGCFNARRMRGGTAWSMHAWGIAVDLDPDRNALRMNHTEARFARSDYNAFWGIVERYGMTSLGRARDFDWMHFQAAGL